MKKITDIRSWFFNAWVKGLRSKKYKKIIGGLGDYETNEKHPKVCALGCAEHILWTARQKGIIPSKTSLSDLIPSEGNIIRMNDNMELPFTKIANYVKDKYLYPNTNKAKPKSKVNVKLSPEAYK